MTRRLAALALAVATLAACGAPLPFDQVPPDRIDVAAVPGFPDARESPFVGIDGLIADYRASFAQQRAADIDRRDGKLDFASLYISGGADYGAYGAGVLYGWSEAGERPEFKVVTGVSTGALTAPFAFLGRERDEDLRRVFTTIGADDIFVTVLLRAIFGGEAVADTTPLQTIIARFADAELVDAVAREHRRGRRLYILTTDLGAQQPWVWNLGAIADSDRRDRVALFRRVLLASAAIPGLFPPVSFDVEANGEAFEELHVDGGVTAQIFGLNGFPPLRELAAEAYRVPPSDVAHTVYALRNGVIARNSEPVRRNAVGILFTSYKILAKAATLKDVALIMESATNNDDEFRLLAIPGDFSTSDYSPFNQDVMRDLFELGRGAMREDDPWLRSPLQQPLPPPDAELVAAAD